MGAKWRTPSSDHHADDSHDDLAVRIRRGDIHAFESLFRLYYDPLRRFAFGYMHSADAAEDIVQEVMVGVWERRAEFATRASPAAYLYRAVRNRALNAITHDAVVRRHEDEVAAGERPIAPATDELVFANDLERALYEQVETLPRRLREVYRLCHDEGLSSAEVANVMGTTVHAVYVQMNRAMKALHGALAPWIEG